MTEKLSRFQERYKSDPEFRERQKQRQRDLRKDPEFIAKDKEYRARADVRARRSKANCEYVKRPEVKEKLNARVREYRKRPHVVEKSRGRQLEKRGYTPELFAALLTIQDGKCAVCGREIGKSAHADHCHDTGVPRGLLCRTCNTVEGHIKSLGLTPAEFGKRLQGYLDKPPADVAVQALELAA